MRPLIFLLLIPLTACLRDETIAAYGAGDHLWILQTIDGRPVTDRSTMTFESQGRISGQGPCNSFDATQTAPYPWFILEGFFAGERHCDRQKAETAFFAGLEDMTLSEVSGTQLILSNDAGREMLFTASETGA